jgi:Dehydrogenase E1 component
MTDAGRSQIRPHSQHTSRHTAPVGNALQVHEVAAEAIARARRGDGPTLIEAQTYRFRGHSLADPDELRPKAEKEKWQVRAPEVDPDQTPLYPVAIPWVWAPVWRAPTSCGPRRRRRSGRCGRPKP